MSSMARDDRAIVAMNLALLPSRPGTAWSVSIDAIAEVSAVAAAPDDSTVDALVELYRAVAGEYFDHTIDVPGSAELLAAIDAFRPAGDVLELACGTGV